MISSIRPAAIRLLAAFFARYYRGEERDALRDLADDRRHAREFRALVDAWETIAREPTLPVIIRAMKALGEALHREGSRPAQARAVLLAGIRAADRVLRFRRQHARADASPETLAAVARDAHAELDEYESLTRAYNVEADAGGPRTPYAAPLEETWEGEGGALAPPGEQ
jgi:hypothetical protein